MEQEIQNKPEVKLVGENGSADNIIACCRQAWQHAGNDMDEWEAIQTEMMSEMMSGDYHNLLSKQVHFLRVVMKYFDVY